MSRIFIWLESSSTLNFVCERDPDEIVQTHIFKPWVNSLRGWYFREKNEYVSQHTIYAFVNVHNSRHLHQRGFRRI